jgi:hypothetical protein
MTQHKPYVTTSQGSSRGSTARPALTADETAGALHRTRFGFLAQKQEHQFGRVVGVTNSVALAVCIQPLPHWPGWIDACQPMHYYRLPIVMHVFSCYIVMSVNPYIMVGKT